MSFAYLPWYTGDYLRDTRHLSTTEHGAYLMLLAYCWDQKGPAPLEERKLSGITNARSDDEMGALRRVLSEFFERTEDGWINPRMQAEIERSEQLSKARSAAGSKGYKARAKQLPSKRKAHASIPNPIPTPTPETLSQRNVVDTPSRAGPTPPHNASDINGKDTNRWDASDRGIDAKARELGVKAKPGETYFDLKRRLWAEINQRTRRP